MVRGACRKSTAALARGTRPRRVKWRRRHFMASQPNLEPTRTRQQKTRGVKHQVKLEAKARAACKKLKIGARFLALCAICQQATTHIYAFNKNLLLS